MGKIIEFFRELGFWLTAAIISGAGFLAGSALATKYQDGSKAEIVAIFTGVSMVALIICAIAMLIQQIVEYLRNK